VLISGSTGVDNYTSGVGASANGTVFVTFSQSSAAQAPALRAAAYHQSSGWQGPIDIAASDASYAGGRWGDFAGIAADPIGGDAVWQTHEVSDADGAWRTVISRLVFDVSAPTVSAPRQALIAGTTLGSEINGVVPTVPVKVSWSGSDPGSGITTYRIDRADHGSGFGTAIPGTTATSSVQAHAWVPVGTGGDNSYTYGAIAVDDGLNASGFAQGAAVTPTVYQHNNSVTYSGSWRTASGPSFSAGNVKYSSTAGSSATFKASGRSFAFVTTKASSRGKVKVYVDGSLKTTLKLASASTRYRNLGYVVSFASSGSHTIKLVVVTGRVDVDAFVVLR